MSGTLSIGGKQIFSHSDVTDKVTYGSGVPVGTIIKIEQFDYTTQFYDATTANTWLDITGFTYTFTPTYNTSKVLVILNLGRAGIFSCSFRVLRNGTPIGAAGSLTGTQTVAMWFNTGPSGSNHSIGASGMYLDSPSSDQGLVYKLQGQSYSTSYPININRTDAINQYTYGGAAYSNFIFIEVSQ